MPIYEFECSTCKAVNEKLQKYTDPAPKCVSCKSEKTMERRVSRTSFALKGTGWYKDHYGLKAGA